MQNRKKLIKNGSSVVVTIDFLEDLQNAFFATQTGLKANIAHPKKVVKSDNLKFATKKIENLKWRKKNEKIPVGDFDFGIGVLGLGIKDRELGKNEYGQNSSLQFKIINW